MLCSCLFAYSYIASMYHSPLAPSSVAGFVGSFPFVGFSGSRSPGGPAVIAATLFCRAFAFPSGRIAVGCASGVDQAVRSAFPGCRVFRAQSSLPWALAARSSKLVRQLYASGGCLVAFPGQPCPSAVRASPSFGGSGSGTWGSVALAVGLGVPCAVFVPLSVSRSGFPSPSSLAARFRCVGGPQSGSWWLFNPVPSQSALKL